MLLGVLGLQNPTERAQGLSFAFFLYAPTKATYVTLFGHDK